ncbi:2-oxoglutarate dehydrogenase E1 component [Shimazuella sp. AN120528]|uniref:2-oxoglutarate dehydrogenase E1 component n=1 Tax=Shimazuella soli TaxID=1892854 RepID=UPI001F0D861B|nr:2-oxoglutarate dehydrogenase E1 component [Shimazuella soli]MCH5586645.1 2-oxoglutarate dehydrogenase E1 component [Shimazuella soli]
MPNDQAKKETPWKDLHGPNLAYILGQYEQYNKDPESVDSTLKVLFEQWGSPVMVENNQPTLEMETDVKKVISAEKLVQYIRTYGHLSANINPLVKQEHALPNHNEYGLNEEDLSKISAELIWTGSTEHVSTALDVIHHLQNVYTKSLAYEFSHVHNQEEREWLYSSVETKKFYPDFSTEIRSELLKRLMEVDEFEKFLQRTFTGQKRFSIEGVDMLVPMIDELIRTSSQMGVRHVMMGMAHRGRLNVLAHILGKPYEKIFSEFHHSTNKDIVPSEGSMGINFGWTGDVKYHLGGDRNIDGKDSFHIRLTLANNPSHLEFVNPVVEGFTRAAQEDRSQPGYPVQDTSKAIALLIHGDAAFPGEGVVAETLNLSQLTGYQTGGTIHIIANNQLGFTTDTRDSRSTVYSSDLAKGFEIPIVHVNADDPEACLAAIRLACEYRTRFQKDFLIDLIGYRRFGHNEMDDPTVTQPLMYEIIHNHPTISAQYAEKLSSSKIIKETDIKQWQDNIREKLQAAHKKMKQGTDVGSDHYPKSELEPATEINTGVSIELLKEINHSLLKRPESFTSYPKLERTLSRRINLLDDEEKVDWALAETLAFATILNEGTAIRFTGQDTERGTFAHRHLVLHDSKTGKTFSPLHSIPQVKAAFGIHNSPLSEASVLGFEYGYNFFAPKTLTLWEAQYGDFANAAQVIIDQFLSAGRAKWRQDSSLVMLLPHGYEGQGPEHSSARLERYLQLAAENNVVIANLTSAAQYFHLLRRQASMIGKEEARPLILMAPKSLIRSKRTISPSIELENSSFQAIKEETDLGEKTNRVKRLVLCSGKIAIDLSAELEASQDQKDWLHIIRVEQLYPYPKKEIQAVIERFKNLQEVVWVQEEPKNMGAWTYMEPKIRETVSDHVSTIYIGRPDRSSPATGKANVHDIEQQRILTEALHVEP